jgi:two-component system nitrogen regulation response regulator GlnG
MGHVLVVDDEPSICWGFRELLTEEGHVVTTVPTAEEALEVTQRIHPDAIILDVRLPGMDGLSAIESLRERVGDVPIIVMTAFGNLQTAVQAVHHGVFEYLSKPFDLGHAAAIVRRALDRANVPSAPATTAGEGELLIGSSLPMQEVFKQIALVAASNVPVLITGESGTGKEVIAKAIHLHSERREGPFLPICLAALSPTIIESELFGHVRGAFTGAEADRPGLLELASGGSILLDEVGDIPLPLQVKLLRAIEQNEITRVGETRSRSTDFRVIAATNRPLVELMSRGEFRQDLFFRLSVFHIEVPPLRERSEDIPTLAEFFLRRMGRAHCEKRFTPAALRELQQRWWPGNVRELRNAVERSAIMARSETIDVDHLPPSVGSSDAEKDQTVEGLQNFTAKWFSARLAVLGPDDSECNLYENYMQLVEPTILEQVLRHCQKNRTAAARLLGVHRATLRDKLRRYGLDG